MLKKCPLLFALCSTATAWAEAVEGERLNSEQKAGEFPPFPSHRLAPDCEGETTGREGGEGRCCGAMLPAVAPLHHSRFHRNVGLSNRSIAC